MRTILGRIIKANKEFKLIENHDVIAVGVSGGKDSMTLLYALGLYANQLKKRFGWEVRVIGIHLRMNLCAIDYAPIVEYWKQQGVEFHIIETKMGEILKANMKGNKIQCSLCSKLKKAILIENAIRLGCNKVAMGHHADDAIETLFMNMINEGRIATFKPKMHMDRTDILFIRPLILAREQEIIDASTRLTLPVIPCGCPMEGFTQRDSMKLFLREQIYNQEKTKAAYQNFYVALMNGNAFDLWFKNDDGTIGNIDWKENDGKWFKEEGLEPCGIKKT